MNQKLTFTLLLIICLGIGICLWLPREQPAIIELKAAHFNDLPGWHKAKLHASFKVFLSSCQTMFKQNPEQNVGSREIPIQAKDWLPACRAALQIRKPTEKKIRHFFTNWFVPYQFCQQKPIQGLFTGYYLPLLHGSLTKTDEYNVPIYALPKNIVTVDPEDFGFNGINHRLIGQIVNGRLIPYHYREAINKGVLKDKARVLVWVNNHVDRLFLEIQGSGIIKLTNGDTIYVGYAGENGAPYTPIAKALIAKGVMTKENASMQGIRAYLETHPQEMESIINTNKSFVFFRILKHTAAMGAQGIALTPGYSLAVDKRWIPLGTPLWLDTTHPMPDQRKPQSLRRLMVAQDTGGAIRGQVRGDVFWGEGDEATYIAGTMKNRGHYWLFLPREVKNIPRRFKNS